MTRPLHLAAPATADPVGLAALLARLRRGAPEVTVRTEPAPGAVTVRLELGAADAAPAGPDTARPLGPHPLLVSATAARVAAVHPGAPADAGVLLVGRAGSPAANAELAKVARLLQEGREHALVEHAYLGRSSPGVAEGLRRCRALGAGHVVVAPYSVLDPPFRETVRAEVARAGEATVTVAAELGDSAELAELVLSRYREVLDGDIRCSCAACAYRPIAAAHG